MDLHTLSIRELREVYRRHEATPVDVVESLAKRISTVDPQLQSYLATDLDLALAEARKADLSLPLGGIPIALKDNINALGQQCTSGSKILAGYRAAYDATVSDRLRNAGAILFGRTNLDEFAMGSSTENSGFYPTRNPWDLNRIPGGSSGGSAAAVAADLAIAALGSDTGGSVRLPAALCGCVGLKPSYGRVSRYGLVAYASSLDQIGPLTKTVEDSALVLQAIAGHDPLDSTSLREPVPAYDSSEISLKGVRLGLPKEYFVEGIDSQVSEAVKKALAWYESMGAELVEISLPNTEYAIAVYYIIATAEASGNLARFDGVRYGHRARGAKDLLEQYRATREEGFGPEVKRRIILGTYVLSAGYHDAFR